MKTAGGDQYPWRIVQGWLLAIVRTSNTSIPQLAAGVKLGKLWYTWIESSFIRIVISPLTTNLDG
jgi:hypothetical protein